MKSLRSELEGTLPADLSTRIEKTALMRIVFEAVEASNWPKPRPVTEGRTPEPVLRTVLVYCYACDILSSVEIESMAKHDPSVRYLCANDLPEFEEVRAFRRQNISRLRESLARVLHEAWISINSANGTASILPFVAEADHRLASAIAADSAAMDY